MAEDLLAKLRNALQRDGDFPASAKTVNELRMLTSSPKTPASQITEVILREPSLGTRVLHLVNSSYYRRAKPIMTVSQAVIQIGMKPLAELCAGLVLLQKFVPAARRSGAFANCLRQTIMTSLLASSFTSKIDSKQDSSHRETGYLAGSFAELGTLLLAYYFPQVYESAVKRAKAKDQSIAKSLTEITGITPNQLSIEVIDALNLPPTYREVLKNAEHLEHVPINAGQNDASGTTTLAQSLYAAKQISQAVSTKADKAELDRTVAEVQNKLGLPSTVIGEIVGQMPVLLKDHCASIDVSLPPLPDYVGSYADEESLDPTQGVGAQPEDTFNRHLEEIREAVENREPTASIITTVMETLAWSLGFSRVLLMLARDGRNKLMGRMLLGHMEDFNPSAFERPLGSAAAPDAPDAQCVAQARPIFTGDPLFKDGWPLVAVPVGYGERTIGVIYADRVDSDAGELSSREQAAVGVLAELLDRSISMNS